MRCLSFKNNRCLRVSLLVRRPCRRAVSSPYSHIFYLSCRFKGIDYFVQMHLDGAGTKECDHWHDDAGTILCEYKSYM